MWLLGAVAIFSEQHAPVVAYSCTSCFNTVIVCIDGGDKLQLPHHTGHAGQHSMHVAVADGHIPATLHRITLQLWHLILVGVLNKYGLHDEHVGILTGQPEQARAVGESVSS